MASKLSQLRQGKLTSKTITLRDGFEVAVVILPTDTLKNIEMTIQKYASENEASFNDNVKNIMYDQHICYHAMRDPGDPNVHISDGVQEVAEILDNEDIARVVQTYSELMLNKAPKIELLTEEELDDLKKFLSTTQLKDLNTVSLVHLKNFHQTIHS